MHKISDENKRRISENVGIPYEKLVAMSYDEISLYIEKKNGKKMKYSEGYARHTCSGDDSVLIDNNKLTTTDDLNRTMDEVIKNYKSKQNKNFVKKKKDDEMIK